jgi:hypothetical protein
MSQKTNDTSPDSRPAITELDQNYLIPMVEPATTRTSFDQSILTASSTSDNPTKVFDDCQRLSLDNPRPISNTQSVSHEQAHTNESPTKQGFVQALPILAENTIERNDSTMSTTAIVTVPQVAKRYHAYPIYIRKHSDRHRSLPTELPHVQSQSSLTEDLADWLMLPGIQSEEIPSQEWDAESAVACSSMSIVSCPAITVVTDWTDSTALDQRETIAEHSISISTTPTPGQETFDLPQDSFPTMQKTTSPDFLEPQHHIVTNRERAASVRSTSSIITRKPLPPTAKICQEVLVAAAEKTMKIDPNGLNLNPVIAGSTPNSELSALQHKMVSQEYDANNKTELRPDASLANKVSSEYISKEPESQQNITPKEMMSHGNVMNNEAVSQQNVLLDASTVAQAPPLNLPAEPVIEERFSIPEKVSVPLPPPDIEDKISTPSPPPITTKPTSAQAKRRAAHQRRMELAFGNS